MSDNVRKMGASKASDLQYVCSTSLSGFSSAGESRALNGISRAVCRVADEIFTNQYPDINDECMREEKPSYDYNININSNIGNNNGNNGNGNNGNSTGNNNFGSNNSNNSDDVRAKNLLEPLRLFFEDVGGGDILHYDD